MQISIKPLIPYDLYLKIQQQKDLYVKFVDIIHLIEIPRPKKIIASHFTKRFEIEFMTSYLFESMLYAYRDYNPNFFYDLSVHPFDKIIHIKIQNGYFSIEYVKVKWQQAK